MAFSRALNWVKKTAITTSIGTGFGAVSGVLSGVIGTSIADKLRKTPHEYTLGEAVEMSTAGSTAIFLAAGLLDQTPLSPRKVLAKILKTDSACGLFIPIFFAASEILAGYIGYEMLKSITNEMPLEDALVNPPIGSPFALIIMAIAYCGANRLLCNDNSSDSQDSIEMQEITVSSLPANPGPRM